MTGKGSKTQDRHEERLAERAKELFDDSVSNLDANARSRLNQARQRAIARRRPPGQWQWTIWVPAAGAAAIAVLAIAMWQRSGNSALQAPTAVASDFELLLDQESLEMLEDLEFYSWMNLDDNGSTTSEENVG